MSNGKSPSDADGGSNPLTPGEIGMLGRWCQRAQFLRPSLVRLGAGGDWAAELLDGLFKRELVFRLDDVSEFIGREGLPSKPVLWIVPTKAGTTRMRNDQPSGLLSEPGFSYDSVSSSRH